MATAQQLPAPAPAARPHEQPGSGVNPVEIEAVPAAAELPSENGEVSGELQGPVARLPVELEVAIPVRDFRVRNLLALEPGVLVESQWASGDDLPLGAGDVQLAWSEFEVIETQLGVRITRLA
jgi:flagellar motor switch/type III secretory pathway protein FliN